MAPRIALQLLDRQEAYTPGDRLQFDYRIEDLEADDLAAVESSVLWHTEGKGDEDMGVHFFDRRTSDGGSDLRTGRVSVTLPNSPLTYDGVVVKIRWCVRIRAYSRKNRKEQAAARSLIEELPFRLLSRRRAASDA